MTEDPWKFDKVEAHDDREDADQAVRANLAGYGDDGTTPRHTLFYFYGGDQDGLRDVARAKGFFVSPTVARPGSVLETTMAVDEASFDPVDQQMHAWAEQFGAEYDGWESAVVKA